MPLVIGCGPVGLAVIAALKLQGLHPIVAADFSPARRALPQRMGADIVVDPAKPRRLRPGEQAETSPAQKAARPPLQALLSPPKRPR